MASTPHFGGETRVRFPATRFPIVMSMGGVSTPEKMHQDRLLQKSKKIDLRSRPGKCRFCAICSMYVPAAGMRGRLNNPPPHNYAAGSNPAIRKSPRGAIG